MSFRGMFGMKSSAPDLKECWDSGSHDHYRRAVTELREALIAVGGKGPYYSEDGECAYCGDGMSDEVYPELVSDFSRHKPDCAWVKAQKAIANTAGANNI